MTGGHKAGQIQIAEQFIMALPKAETMIAEQFAMTLRSKGYVSGGECVKTHRRGRNRQFNISGGDAFGGHTRSHPEHEG